MPPSIPCGGLGLTLLSCCLTATVVGNAYYQKKQFYPSVVYITKSNPSMAAIYLMAFTMVILFGKLLKKIFFGTLRAAESEHLIERFFYAVTETCLAFTVFRDDFSPKFVALFTVLLFLKAFHWLSDYRVDYMERSPVITRIFHIRVASLLILLSTIDILLVRHAYHSTMQHGASVQLVFGFEYAILLTVAYNIGVKYICHGIDLQSENPWENKAMYLLYTELFVGFIKVLLYLAFLFIMVRIHTFPLFIIRPMYLTMKSFKKALQDILQSRRAIHNMNTQYPNATEEDLRESDNVCIICRDEMVLNTGVKKLPCNHLFHAICLRSWFQRQQTCPTCRLDVLRPSPNRTATAAAAPAPAPAAATPNAAAANNNAAVNNNNQGQQQGARRPPPHFVDFMQQMMEQAQQRNNQPNVQQNNAATPNANAPPPAAMMPPFPLIPPQLLQHMRQNAENRNAGTTSGQNNAGSTNTAGASTSPSSTAGFTMPLPPFPPVMMGGMFPPPPIAPRDYGPMTQQELEDMEGREREQVVKRLEALHNIHTLVSAAYMQLTQYNSLMSNLDVKMPLPPRAQSTTTTTTTTSSDDANSQPSTSNTSVNNSSSSAQQNDESVKTNKDDGGSGSANEASTSPITDDDKNVADSSISQDTPGESGSASHAPGERGTTADDTAEEVRRRRLEHFVASSH